jgi:NADPH-dependent 2,4-dienoyl-CoA reductase/sulfur reductase-like enzyme/nitrite reductase/ring-hydroxylating ferredoxin subunit
MLRTSLRLFSVQIGRSYEFVEGLINKVQITPGTDLAVMRVAGQTYTVSNQCPHHGVPLHTGYLDRYTLFSPADISSFDIRSGEMKSGPALKGLQSFKTSEVDGRVYVELPTHDSLNTPVDSNLYVRRNPSNPTHYVIIGGGPAANMTAETLRKVGFEGAITMLSRESVLPYDRTVLSKDFTVKASQVSLRSEEFYHKYDIDVRLNTEAVEIDILAKLVRTRDNQEIKYDKLCVATGSRPKVTTEHEVYLNKCSNLFTLQSATDHAYARQQVESAQDVLVIGGSFIGLEAANAIKTKWPSKRVTVFDSFEYPLGRAFGPEIAISLIEASRHHGVNVHVGRQPEQIIHKGNTVTGIRYGHQLYEAGAVLLATGSQPVTEFLPPAMLNDDKTVRVNAFMQTASPDIYAIGDIASFPNPVTETRHTICHWKTAGDQGVTAALDMVGLGRPLTSVPYYSTKMQVKADCVGYVYGADWYWTTSLQSHHDFTTPKFTVFYKGYRAVGVATMGIPNGAAIFSIGLERGLLPDSKSVAKGNAMSFEEIKARVMTSSLCSVET